jgi:hypothetical protein
MNPHADQSLVSRRAPIPGLQSLTACGLAIASLSAAVPGGETKAEPPWRSLPLIADGKVAEGWLMASAEREEGPWFAGHRGYEVQIMDANDNLHRTGAIYSLAASSAISRKLPGDWRTMIITLAGNGILVDLEGQRVTSFDPNGPDVPRERKWFEPKREPKRPETGYLGLQNHDSGDVVWFREISVRALADMVVGLQQQ